MGNIFYCLLATFEDFDPFESLELQLLVRSPPDLRFRDVNNILSFYIIKIECIATLKKEINRNQSHLFLI
jgi:hypothetical protein